MFIIFYITVICFIFYIIVPNGFKLIWRKKFRTFSRQSEYVYLTFDDGPNPTSTPQILNLLEEFNVKATFFLLGEHIEKYPDIVKRIVEMGHEIGYHSFWHTHAWKSGPFRTLFDLIRGKNAIDKYYLSKNTLLFRPPYGKLNLFSLIYIILKRWRLAFWSLDPKDYNIQSGEKIAQFIIDNLSHGSVVILHDGRIMKNSDPRVTVTAVRLILEYSKKRNLKFGTIGKLFE